MHLSAAQFGLNLVYYCNTFCGGSEELMAYLDGGGKEGEWKGVE